MWFLMLSVICIYSKKLVNLNTQRKLKKRVYNRYDYYFVCSICNTNVVLDMSPPTSLPTAMARSYSKGLIAEGNCRKCWIKISNLDGNSRRRSPSGDFLRRLALVLLYLTLPALLLNVYITEGADALKSYLLRIFALIAFVFLAIYAAITIIIIMGVAGRRLESYKYKQAKYLNLEPRIPHALTLEQAQIFDIYIKDKRYSPTCYKILKLIDKHPTAFIYEALRPQGIKYLVGGHSYAKFYSKLDQSEKAVYLAQLSKLSVAKIKLSAGDSLTEDEAISVLLSATTLTEIKQVKERFPKLSVDKIANLVSSDRPKTIGALNSLCFDNFSKSDSWANLSLNDKVFSLEYRMTSYIQNKPNYKSYLKENYISMGYQVKSHLLSELSTHEIHALLLDPQILYFHKDPDAVQVIINLNKLNYLSLLVYHSKKHGLKVSQSVEDTLNDLLNLFKFTTCPKEWKDYVLELEGYNNDDLSIDILTANNIGIYSLSLDLDDYLFTHKFAKCILPISYRDDYDVYLGLNSFTKNSDIFVALKPAKRTISRKVMGGEYALYRISVNCIDIAFKNKLYLLSPYLISIQSEINNQGEENFIANFSNLFCGLSKESFYDFYESISCKNYPLLEEDNLDLIKKRIEEIFLRTRQVKVTSNPAFEMRKIYSSNFSLGHKWMHVELAAGSKFINYGNGTSGSEEFLKVLEGASNWVDLEKIIIIFSNFPYRKKGYSFRSVELLNKYGTYGESNFLLPLSKDLSVEELKLACSLLQGWEGSEKDFRAMIKTL